MHDGVLIKKLRVDHRLTQSQLAKGICSKTALVGMENESVKKISFLTLRAFLDRLNVSLAEYEWLRNTAEEPEKKQLQRKVLYRLFEEEFDIYKEIADNRKKYRKSTDIYYLILNIQLFQRTERQIVTKVHLDFLKYECSEIENYFKKLKDFGRFELEILANYPFLFAEVYIEANYVKIKRKMRQLSGLESKEHCLFLFQLNLTKQYIALEKYKKAASINKELLKLLSEYKREKVIYERLLAEFYHYTLNALLGNEKKAQGLDHLLQVIGYTMGEARQKKLRREYEKLVERSAV